MYTEKVELFGGKFNLGTFHGLYSPGTSKKKEDGWAVEENVIGVFDAFSEPNSPDHPQIIIKGMSLGEITSGTIKEYLGEVNCSSRSLPEIFGAVNDALLSRKEKLSIPKETIRLVGASFAAIKPGEEKTEGIAGGDCFLLARQKNGEIIMSENQVHLHDTEMNNKISELMQEAAEEMGINLKYATRAQISKVRGGMWNKFRPVLKKERGQAINNPESPSGYASLNGDPRMNRMPQSFSFPTKEIQKIILFSDGWIDWKFLSTLEKDSLAKFISELEERMGPEGVLHFTRSAESIRDAENYVSQAEATALVLRFQ